MSILHLNVLDHATTIMECDFDDELHWWKQTLSTDMFSAETEHVVY
jgi:hypothetical protein